MNSLTQQSFSPVAYLRIPVGTSLLEIHKEQLQEEQ
jgi:hypothetical protein